jgi:signal peptidase II
MVQPIVKQTSLKSSNAIDGKSLIPDFKSHLIFWPLAIGGLALDLWSKWAVFKKLELGESYNVIDGFLQLMTAQNNGAAWGIFHGRSVLLAAVSGIALISIILIFFFSGRQPRIIQVALGFFAAGVSGNLYDRYFNHGLVRDFIAVHYHNFEWPTFNVADSLLVIGVGLLTISTIFIEKPAQKHDQQQK